MHSSRGGEDLAKVRGDSTRTSRGTASGGAGVGGSPARPAAAPWDDEEFTGLSSLHIGPHEVRWGHHPFVGGESWGWNDHPGNRQCVAVDPFAEASEQLARSPWSALPASMLTKLER